MFWDVFCASLLFLLTINQWIKRSINPLTPLVFVHTPLSAPIRPLSMNTRNYGEGGPMTPQPVEKCPWLKRKVLLRQNLKNVPDGGGAHVAEG